MANLVELFDNIVQMQNLNGVPLAAGKLYVYALGRTRLMDSWSDVDGESLNPNPIILDDAGQAHVYVSDDFNYTLVVCDQYNNEIFSLDKYLYSEGSHSHADVAVAPSESIAVSSYHVGETTVYVPYLTGQLGKVYEGIDPIVVNNQVDKISANHVPLGVQDPLYFVQDDEEGCIIGFSGETLPEGTMNESAFGYQDGQITSYNGSAFRAGNSYEAGSYVSIDGNTINVTGLQPAGNYQSAGDYVSASELENLQPKGDYYSASNPSGFITGVDLTDYAKTEDLTAYQPIGNYYSASNPSGFINSDSISAMATTGFVADVSGDITAMIPSTAGLATQDWVTGQGYLTAHQSLDGLMSADLLEISDNKITGYNGTAFAGQGGGVSGDFELSAGSGISIVDYPLEQKTVISVTAQGGNPEVGQAVIDNSATWNTVSDKLDTTAFSDVSGTFLTALPSDLVYTADIQDMATTGDLTAYATVESLTAKQDSLTFGYHDTVISSINSSALYDNSAHARINTLAGRISNLSSNKLDTTAFSDVSGSFLTAVPAGTMNESNFAYDASDNITAYNGSAFKAGDEFPQSATEAIETVTANSGDWNATTDTVSANSGAWGGSALPISAGPGIKFSIIDNTLVTQADETVLFSGSFTVTSGSYFNVSESINNFEKISFQYGRLVENQAETEQIFISNPISYNLFFIAENYDSTQVNLYAARLVYTDSDLRLTVNTQVVKRFANTSLDQNITSPLTITKVIGINRK